MDPETPATRLSDKQRTYLALQNMQARIDDLEYRRREPVAIVGMSCRFPGAPDLDAFWTVLEQGIDAVSEVPRDRWDAGAFFDTDPDAPGKAYTRWGGFIDGVDQFDATFFGISRREAAAMDPQQRLLLEVSWEALEHACIPADALDGTLTGVFIGVCGCDYRFLHSDVRSYNAYLGTGSALSVLAGRISYTLGLNGPCVCVDTACSSSLVSLHLAAQSLRTRECDVALAGGVNLILRPDGHIIFSKARMMAHDGRCKTFDASADGFVRSEGCGIVVMKRLSDAIANRDRILGVVRGSAMSQDGRSNGLAAPNGTSQEEVIRRALAAAGLEPRQIQYVEAHGTGTSLGDPIEMRALGRALGSGRDRTQPFWAGSVKSNIGHAEAAAGAAAIIKTLLAMQHRVIPASLHFREPNPYIPWDEVPVSIPTRTEPWSSGSEPRRAGVNGFGFSGTNAHVILEEAPAEPASPDAASRSRQLLCLSARSDTALRAAAGRLAAHLERHPATRLHDVCYTAAIGRSHLPHRLALVAGTTEECRSALQAFADGDNAVLAGGPRSAPKVAFVFTGQGAWRAGQGQTLYRQEPVFRAAVDACSRLFEPHLGRPLVEAFASGAAIESLGSASMAQAGLFSLEYALAALWRSWGIEPHAVMGHSLGEYVAACVAGVLSLEDAVTLVATRASLMDLLPSDGAMASVRAPESVVREALAPFTRTVSIAAINGPKQVVVSGRADDVATLCARLEARGVTCIPLRVTHAFHSPLLDPILDRFEAVARQVRYAPPRTPIVSNVTGRWVDDDTLGSARYWRQHMREAVRFSDGVEALHAHGIGAFVEVGPEPTLLGLVRQSSKGASALRVPSMKGGEEESQSILAGLGELFKAGATVDWVAFSRGFEGQKLALPTYPFERKRHWVDDEAQYADDAAATDAGPAASPTSLLGRQMASPLADRQYANRVGVAAWPFLADHRVFETPIMPAAWYIASAAEALERAPEPSGREVCDLTILEPLPVGDGEFVLQTVVSPGTDGEARVRIFSRAATADAAVPWRCHSESVIRTTPAHASDPSDLPTLDTIWQRCQRDIPPALFYELLAARGIQYGHAFQGIRRLRVGTNEAAAEVVLPDGLASLDAMHPALLDACLQVLVAAGGSDRSAAEQDLYLPVSLARCSRLGRMPSRVRVWAAIDAVEGETTRSSLVIFDETGAPVAWLSGLTGRRVTREMLGIAAEEKVEDWFYETTWQAQALSAPGLPTPRTYETEALRASLQTRAAVLGEQHRLEQYLPMLAPMDGLMRGYILQALRRLGWQPAPGDVWTAAALRTQLGIAAGHERLLHRYLDILADDGWLRREGAAWRVTAAPAEEDVSGRGAALAAAHPIAATELQFAGRVGERLSDVLRGTVDPLELLFPGGSADSAEALYRDAPFARAINDLLGSAFERIVADWPERRAIRVLEIGAGTGGTTLAALAHLPDDRLEYVYTDVSPLLVQHGRDRFQSRAGMSFAVLDVERDPVSQGFTPGSADLVIAANVLHATRDLRTTLRHARALLAPGGVLLLIESVERQPLLDVIFGTTEGWWRFEDTELRPDYPLLTDRAWCDLLDQNGFEEVFAAPANEPGQPTAKHKLIVARSVRQVEHPATSGAACLIVGDHAGLDAALAPLVEARGLECLRLSPDSVAPRHDPAAMRAQTAQTLRAVGRPVRDVVFLPGVDVPASDPVAGQPAWCGSALGVAQGVVDAGLTGTRLWIVTRGAQPVLGRVALDAVGPATLWGFGRAIGLEHPELAVTLVDLDDALPVDRLAALLDDEVRAGTREGEVAYRGSHRYVARVDRILQRSPEALHGLSWRLEPPPSGTLDDLRLVRQEERPPSEGEVEIDVACAGLNFLDVLQALRTVPTPVTILGAECAGRVTRVGPGVTEFAAGDEVMALSPNCIGNRAVVRAATAARKPGAWTLAESAGAPVAFVTAWDALVRDGGLHAGQRVLIHAAAGGVGQAAVQVARHVGAEIFGTAGSDAKRRLVLDQGARAVGDSRNASFAAVIREATGGEGVDVVLNSLSGPLIEQSLALLRPGGCFIEIGKRNIRTADEVRAIRPDVRYVVYDLFTEWHAQPEAVGQTLRHLGTLFDTGALRPIVGQTVPMSQAASAFRTMAQGRHTGKIVLSNPGFDAPRRRFTWDAGGTILITGGFGGLGLSVARWFSDRGAKHIALLGRSGPGEAAAVIIQAIERNGTTVDVIRADVSDAAAMQRVVAGLPALKVVVHSAGALADRLLRDQTWETFGQVFAAKVTGAWTLHRLTEHLSLDAFVLFSSVASFVGSPGQSNHSAGNAFLDGLAHARRTAGLPAQSINWGAWSEIGAAAEHQVEGRLAKWGLGTIAPRRGLQAFERMLDAGLAQAAVVPVEWTRFLHQFEVDRTPPRFAAMRRKAAPAGEASALAAREQLLARLRDALPTEREELVVEFVRDQVSMVLGLAGDEKPDVLEPLRNLGLDSLMAVELRNALTVITGGSLPASLLFDYPSIDALGRYLAREMFDIKDTAATDGATAPTTVEEPADEIASLDAGSVDAQLEAFLDRELGTE